MLYPLIMAISVIGIYSINGDMVDLYLMLFFGVVGYLFNKAEIPVAPLVLALVLGDVIEQSFRQAMTISDDSLTIFFSSGITVTLMMLTAISLLWPFIISGIRALKRSREPEVED